MSSTTIAVWLHAVLNALQARGLDADALAAAAGLARARQCDPMARVPVAAMTRLWQSAEQASGDAAFALDVPAHFSPTYFQALGVALVSSATVREALHRVVAFYRLVSDSVEVCLQHSGAHTALVIRASGAPDSVHPAAVEAFMAVLVDGLVRTARVPVRPVQAQLMRAPCAAPRFAEWFGSVRFGAAEHRLLFERHGLETPLLTANPSLAAHADRELHRTLAAQQGDPLLVTVQVLLWRALCEQQQLLDQDALAAQLHLSTRTLRRRLQRAGTRLQTLQTAARKRRAAELLLAGEPVGQVAAALGYQDAGNFSTAFRRWYRCAPRTFQQRGGLPLK
ncbi:AraC family transcriptional regulator ligand-binding domain-containing protein [Isoalcanivorax beigongshangi]|uniref:AraC family transcriptional regulator ligand-binding domain-containing protein n=1 Tax=Isoalcanivorax beigongshangi TaxID=3238810 RepID=A0ABV4AES5_9GAMM